MQLIKSTLTLLSLVVWLFASKAMANDCTVGEAFDHSFASGGSWQFCVVLDDDHALELQNIYYQAPGDISRKVLKNLHLGQVLLHYHDSEQPVALVGNSRLTEGTQSATTGLGGTALKTLTDATCEGEVHDLISQPAKLCSYVRETGLLAKYNTQRGVQGSEYRLFSVSSHNGLTFQTQIALSEDGRIIPAVVLSGASHSTTSDTRFGNPLNEPVNSTEVIGTRATLLYTWRMAFALNNDDPDDSVEEFNFKLEPDQGSRRSMEISALGTETLRKKDRDLFRGWRVKDSNGSGYYLDPQNSGYGYTDKTNNWAQFDLAVTAFNECERHSTIVSSTADTNSLNAISSDGTECLGSLDDYVSGDSMTDRSPVLWYSLSRVYRPKAEDYPIISSLQVDFEIIPFDWTQRSPFEIVQ